MIPGSSLRRVVVVGVVVDWFRGAWLYRAVRENGILGTLWKGDNELASKGLRGLLTGTGKFLVDGIKGLAASLKGLFGRATDDLGAVVNDALIRGIKRLIFFSGTHGFPNGTLQAETRFLDEDIQNFADVLEVTVHDISVMTQDEIEAVLRNSGIIIAGFCDSKAWLAKFLGLLNH